MTKRREELTSQVRLVDNVGDDDDLDLPQLVLQVGLPVVAEEVDFCDADVTRDAVVAADPAVVGVLPQEVAVQLEVAADGRENLAAINVWKKCAAVERTPRNIEVVGSNPTRCWAFFPLLYPLSSVSLIQIPQATLLIFLQKTYA